MDMLGMILFVVFVVLLCRPFYAHTRPGMFLEKLNLPSPFGFRADVNALDKASTMFISVVFGIAFAGFDFEKMTFDQISPLISFFLFLIVVLWFHRRPAALIELYEDETEAFSELVGRVGMILFLALVFFSIFVWWLSVMGQYILIVALIVDLILQVVVVGYLLASRLSEMRRSPRRELR